MSYLLSHTDQFHDNPFEAVLQIFKVTLEKYEFYKVHEIKSVNEIPVSWKGVRTMFGGEGEEGVRVKFLFD